MNQGQLVFIGRERESFIKHFCDLFGDDGDQWAGNMVSYKRPPIIEAIVEFAFVSPISFEIVERATDRIKRLYKFDETEEMFENTVDTGSRTSKLNYSKQGRKLSSEDRTHFTIIRRNSLVFSEVPPYLGWPAFIERIRRDVGQVRKDRAIPPAGRIGMRYVNRIDVSHRAHPNPQVENFLKFVPSAPNLGGRVSTAYMLRTEYPQTADFPFELKVTSATVEAPLVHTSSFLLDLDVISTSPPRDEPGIWNLVEAMKKEEDSIFESSITEAARELFRV
ncbi:TIGR04255 family protein [Mesorhizobium sp. M7A.F.Ca.MR.176.00.0.0]|uniref:TIGR04255 family protein n=1 Tax=Mesorhizobium sp. M7A.F.Ca.MR.176.00.0.0 TaxID=2496776 RepID=UPI000FD35456|nr:TIGR04255 family protein [Mesorhizobium sp. M7A.F.Ca.MR.176.00.0.0]RUU93362.1 TIGR04255 family protein [Mesorhizobium sp. M7A.F.Ca.MR.176.00.0.0]